MTKRAATDIGAALQVLVLASFILKGWKSLSPGLRGTSYPGVGGPLNLNPERVLSKALNKVLSSGGEGWGEQALSSARSGRVLGKGHFFFSQANTENKGEH